MVEGGNGVCVFGPVVDDAEDAIVSGYGDPWSGSPFLFSLR